MLRHCNERSSSQSHSLKPQSEKENRYALGEGFSQFLGSQFLEGNFSEGERTHVLAFIYVYSLTPQSGPFQPKMERPFGNLPE
ncbi:hypothetical protein XELAEV_18010845mg [Xenopus laevis]|uniref:Uncharacterized protein n=1 Tax=Xenopus laevis TaxID=8355 RepID=A0A974DV01_XENLA|nr:hypothetical protein XELAEV_18010845mg [Xenopus laevis]